MQFDILTLFPEMFNSPFNVSLMKKAKERNLVRIRLINLRNFAFNKHRNADDYPYGGGTGMIMKIEPIAYALQSISPFEENSVICLLTPQGMILNQNLALQLAQKSRIILICGRYEGIDNRVSEYLIDKEISIGDFILTGGELAAMVVIDSVSRLLNGFLGNKLTIKNDSFDIFNKSLLEYPQYTRPAKFWGLKVPKILLSGNHKKINYWRRKESLKCTFLKRPDLLKNINLSEEEQTLLKKLKLDLNK